MDNTVSSLFLRNPEAAGALRRQQLAMAMMQRTQGQGPMLGPMSVLGSAGQTLMAAMMNRGAEDDLGAIGERQRTKEAETKAQGDALIQQIMGSFGGGEGGQAPPASPPMSTLPPVARGAPGKMGAMAPPPELMPHFQRAAAENNIPLPALLAQAKQESNFNPNAVGKAGEIGLMQIMPSTARSPGFGVPPADPATLREPGANISFGARYMRGRAGPNADLSNPTALASALRNYNGGGDPNYVQNVTQHMPGAGGAVPGASAPMRADATGSYVGGEAAGAPAGRGDEDRQRLLMAAALSDDPRLQRLAPILGAQARRENRAPVSVAPGSTLVDPNTGQAIFSAPKDRSAEPLERVIGPNGQPQLVPRSQAMGAQPFVPERQPPPLLPPDVEDQQRRLREAGKPSTNIDMRAETAEAGGRGKSLAEEGERVRLGGEAASGILDTVRHVRTLGADTGRLAGAQEMIGGWMDAMGVRGSDIVRKAKTLQEFNAAASNFVLGKQLEQKGVQSESDAKRMRDTFASITNTTEANDAILRATEAQAHRAMERADFYQSWRQQHNGSVDGANEAWSKHIRETPMVAKGPDGGLIFVQEYMPAAAEHFGGNREKALELWRKRAAR